MMLVYQLSEFYGAVHKCVKGRGSSKFAWEIINRAIESTQDGGTAFAIERPANIKVDNVQLTNTLVVYGMDSVEVVEK